MKTFHERPPRRLHPAGTCRYRIGKSSDQALATDKFVSKTITRFGRSLRYRDTGSYDPAHTPLCDRRDPAFGSTRRRLVRRRRSGQEAVSDTANSEQVQRLGWIFFNILAQPYNKVVDGTGVGVFVQSPHFF